jgi:hypothetical protein
MTGLVDLLPLAQIFVESGLKWEKQVIRTERVCNVGANTFEFLHREIPA